MRCHGTRSWDQGWEWRLEGFFLSLSEEKRTKGGVGYRVLMIQTLGQTNPNFRGDGTVFPIYVGSHPSRADGKDSPFHEILEISRRRDCWQEGDLLHLGGVLSRRNLGNGSGEVILSCRYCINVDAGCRTRIAESIMKSGNPIPLSDGSRVPDEETVRRVLYPLPTGTIDEEQGGA